MKLGFMAAITALITLIAEIAFIFLGNGAGAGITLAFGLMVSYTFRLIYEMKGGERMLVFCQKDECRWNQNGECDRGVITIDYNNECEDFESYLDDAEWQKPYWKRILDRETNQIYRVLFYGKEIEINGLKFFVDVNSDYAIATEETTGLNSGERCKLESRIEKIIEYKQKFDMPPLDTLPIGEYDKKTGRVKPKQAEQKGSE